MSSVGDRYIFRGKDDHDRLRVISEIHDSRTQALLSRAGLAAQRRFVEFGCGLGYVTRWAAAPAGLARGVNYAGGRCAHTWAREAGFEIVHADAYHPHYLEGPHKGFWNWTLRNGTRRLVDEGVLTEARWTELVDGMTQADNSRDTVVAHCRMHHLIARKPLA
jgi:hypothetical protein